MYDEAGRLRASAVVTALTWMVRDFQAEEEWPELERPLRRSRSARQRASRSCSTTCAVASTCRSGSPTPKAAVELLGEAAWPRIRATFAPKGGPLRRTRVSAS